MLNAAFVFPKGSQTILLLPVFFGGKNQNIIFYRTENISMKPTNRLTELLLKNGSAGSHFFGLKDTQEVYKILLKFMFYPILVKFLLLTFPHKMLLLSLEKLAKCSVIIYK